ncbi:hypothetical protein JOF55_000780 [Haloactinomyces albus]|uniref:Uncharacterized protein n=1 Tax=Haloactinomyces albus TaxID=1352928 RepID=A0AAE3ZCH6_9ACTN|nr:hypothetical protein [Haloactinomyces albus]
MTKRENSRRRRAPRAESRSLILVVCGGVKTEKQYLEGLRKYYRNLADASDVDRQLRRHLPSYDKTRLVFGEFAEGIEVAVARAAARCEYGREHRCNPSTGVWKLVAAMVPTQHNQPSPRG